jgi:hypothetical protein
VDVTARFGAGIVALSAQHHEGIEAYYAIQKALSLAETDAFPLHPLNATSLLKLCDYHLISLGFSPNRAKEINDDLAEGNYDLLGQAMGVHFKISDDAPCLKLP